MAIDKPEGAIAYMKNGVKKVILYEHISSPETTHQGDKGKWTAFGFIKKPKGKGSGTSVKKEVKVEKETKKKETKKKAETYPIEEDDWYTNKG